jgi:hypothetical protein
MLSTYSLEVVISYVSLYTLESEIFYDTMKFRFFADFVAKVEFLPVPMLFLFLYFVSDAKMPAKSPRRIYDCCF